MNLGRAGTMSFMCSSARPNKKRLNLDLTGDDREYHEVKSERYSRKPLPRKISRPTEDIMSNGASSDLYAYTPADNCFALADLKAVETNYYTNLEAYPHAFQEDMDVLRWVAALMTQSPLALALLRDAEETGWKVMLTDLDTGGYHLDVSTRTIELDHYALSPSALGRSQCFRNSLATVFIKALRDVWHENRWGDIEREYKPEALLMLERARAADADTVAILASWELRGAGFNEVWRHVLGSEEGDMAMIFTRVLERDPTALFNGTAMAHTFRQWYAEDDRIDGVDHGTLEHMDDLLSESGEDKPFGTLALQGEAIEALSVLPDGIKYLSGMGEGILKEPSFVGLNDPLNQAHLFHIVYDMETITVNGVPFRDAKLARKLFPQGDIRRT